jgi:hypothetical protein
VLQQLHCVLVEAWEALFSIIRHQCHVTSIEGCSPVGRRGLQACSDKGKRGMDEMTLLYLRTVSHGKMAAGRGRNGRGSESDPYLGREG